MKFKRYIIPSVDVGGERKNLVLKSDCGASMAAGKSSSSIGYLLEGDVKKNYQDTMSERIFGKFKDYSVEEFDKILNEKFGNCGIPFLGDKIEMFADENNLTPTRLVFGKA